MGFDLKITGGTIIDGTGRPGRPGDVAIDGGRVAAVGTVEGDADEVIEAQGCVVAPGFVDIHTHYDAQIIWDRALTVSPWHGVTSVVIGNCGFGVAPTRPADHDLVVKTLEKVEGMSADALRAGLGEPWPFETFPDYLDTLEERAPLINVAAMIGHTPLRLYVMGSEATSREATTDEITVMKGLVAEALEAGALGFSSSKSNTHVGYEGRPVPSRLASGDEILELAGVLGDAGRGVMQATMGPGLLFDDFAAITERTGRPLSWTALLAGMAEDWLLAESHELVDRGLPVHPQVSCRPLMFEFDLAEPFPLESSRLFADISAGDPAAKRAVYADPSWRARFREKMATSGAGPFRGSWERTVISWCPADRGLEERGVVDVAAERGLDPSDLVLDLSLETGLEARFRMAVLNYDEDAVEALLTDPITHLGLSDAGAHASQLCDACFSTHLLGHWVRERKAMTLEEAVRMLTSEPAEIFGLTDRGLLAEGRPADVVVFDPETVGTSGPRRVADLPGGADRLVTDGWGIEAVLVNGTVIRRNGADTLDPDGDLPGRLLRGGSAG